MRRSRLVDKPSTPRRRSDVTDAADEATDTPVRSPVAAPSGYRISGLQGRVITALGRAIVSGRFAPGELLPREAELMAEFSASRPSFREALKVLAAKGLGGDAPEGRHTGAPARPVEHVRQRRAGLASRHRRCRLRARRHHAARPDRAAAGDRALRRALRRRPRHDGRSAPHAHRAPGHGGGGRRRPRRLCQGRCRLPHRGVLRLAQCAAGTLRPSGGGLPPAQLLDPAAGAERARQPHRGRCRPAPGWCSPPSIAATAKRRRKPCSTSY